MGAQLITSTTIGLIGEHIAAAAILSHGLRVGMAQQDKVDLIAWDDNRFYRVQVKAAQINTRPGRQPSYHHQFGAGSKSKVLPTLNDYDIIALVGIHHRRCIFYPTEQIQQYTKRTLAKTYESETIERDSLAKALEIIEARI